MSASLLNVVEHPSSSVCALLSLPFEADIGTFHPRFSLDMQAVLRCRPSPLERIFVASQPHLDLVGLSLGSDDERQPLSGGETPDYCWSYLLF